MKFKNIFLKTVSLAFSIILAFSIKGYFKQNFAYQVFAQSLGSGLMCEQETVAYGEAFEGTFSSYAACQNWVEYNVPDDCYQAGGYCRFGIACNSGDIEISESCGTGGKCCKTPPATLTPTPIPRNCSYADHGQYACKSPTECVQCVDGETIPASRADCRGKPCGDDQHQDCSYAEHEGYACKSPTECVQCWDGTTRGNQDRWKCPSNQACYLPEPTATPAVAFNVFECQDHCTENRSNQVCIKEGKKNITYIGQLSNCDEGYESCDGIGYSVGTLCSYQCESGACCGFSNEPCCQIGAACEDSYSCVNGKCQSVTPTLAPTLTVTATATPTQTQVCNPYTDSGCVSSNQLKQCREDGTEYNLITCSDRCETNGDYCCGDNNQPCCRYSGSACKAGYSCVDGKCQTQACTPLVDKNCSSPTQLQQCKANGSGYEDLLSCAYRCEGASCCGGVNQDCCSVVNINRCTTGLQCINGKCGIQTVVIGATATPTITPIPCECSDNSYICSSNGNSWQCNGCNYEVVELCNDAGCSNGHCRESAQQCVADNVTCSLDNMNCCNSDYICRYGASGLVTQCLPRLSL